MLRLPNYCILNHVVIRVELNEKVLIDVVKILDRVVEKLFAAQNLPLRTVLTSVARQLVRRPIRLELLFVISSADFKKRSFLLHVEFTTQFQIIVLIFFKEYEELDYVVDLFRLFTFLLDRTEFFAEIRLL